MTDTKALEDCYHRGTHLTSCDSDGFCNYCGYQDETPMNLKLISPADIEFLIRGRMEDSTIPDKVAVILLAYDGKQISKRLATLVEKAMPEYTVRYENAYGMYHLRIWGNGIPYDQMKSFLLGYESQGKTFNHKDFTDKYNVCYYSALQERNSIRLGLLDSVEWQAEVAETINTLNAAKAKLETLAGWPDNPDAFDIARLVDK